MKKLLLSSLIIISLLLFACSPKGSIDNKDLVFVYSGTSFLLDSDVAQLIETLGGDYEYIEAPSCVYEGNDKTFVYEDFEIYTYPLDGKDLIDEIIILSSEYETSRGISVGDTVDELKKAYGDKYTDQGGLITYHKNQADKKSPVIYFYTQNGVIVSIHYYSASNISE